MDSFTRAVLVTAVAMGIGGRAEGQSPCLTNGDTSATNILNVTQTVTQGDSAHLAQLGLPYKPAGGVALVTDSLTCRAIINAYNGQSAPDSTTDVIQAYVMSVGTSTYAMVGDKSPKVMVFFDSTYHLLASLVEM